MAAVLEQQSDDPEQQQLETLERTLAAMCIEASRLADTLRATDAALTRETTLQLMALDERRSQALACLTAPQHEPRQFRIGRLERLVEALDCSWSYFSTQHSSGAPASAAHDRAILVR